MGKDESPRTLIHLSNVQKAEGIGELGLWWMGIEVITEDEN